MKQKHSILLLFSILVLVAPNLKAQESPVLKEMSPVGPPPVKSSRDTAKTNDEFNLEEIVKGGPEAPLKKIYIFPASPYSKGLNKAILDSLIDIASNEFKAAGDYDIVFPKTDKIKFSKAKKIKIPEEPFPLEGKWATLDDYHKKNNFTRARKTIRALLKKYSPKAKNEKQYYQLQKLYLYYGYVLWKQSASKAARKVLILSMLIDFFKDHSNYFKDSFFRGFYNKVRRDMLVKKRSVIRVSSVPEGATVYYYGRELGSTPIILSDAVYGIHQISLKLEEGVFYFKKLKLKRASDVKVFKSWLKPYNKLGKKITKIVNEKLSVTRKGSKLLAKTCKKKKADNGLFLGVVSIHKLIKVQPIILDCKTGKTWFPRELRIHKDMENASLEFSTLAVELSSMVEDQTLAAQKFPAAIFTGASSGALASGKQKVSIAPPAPKNKGVGPVLIGGTTASSSSPLVSLDDGDALDLSLSDEDLEKEEVHFDKVDLDSSEISGDSKPFYENMWFWVGVGAVVTAAGVTALIVSNPDETETSVEVSWD